MPGATNRFFWFLTLLVVAGCAGYAAALLAATSLAAIQHLDGIAAAHERWHIRAVTAGELDGLRRALAGLAALAAGAGAVALHHGWAEAVALWVEIGAIGRGGRHRWRRLPRRARLGALVGLAVLTALRTYFSLTKPLHAEEIASYEFFVSQGWLAVSAYYPIPNNHILSNLVSWVCYQASPGFWWSMRLPVLLLSTAGTAVLFAGTLGRAGFRVAFWAAAGFSWLQLSLYNASAGRGYWLLITLAGLLFFCTLALGRSAGRSRAAWAGLLLAGVAGCYTVPTFAYALASALGWLGWHFGRRRAWTTLGRLAAVGGAVGLGSAALYAPTGLVSGARLLGNGFVAARAAGVFWPGLPAYLWYTEGLLAGQRTVGALVVAAVVAASVYWLRRPAGAAGLAPTAAGRERQQLARAALWFLFFPYLLVLVQRVFPPERVLLYKSFFLFLLVALLADAWRRRPLSTGLRRWSAGLLLAGFAGFVAYQTYYVEYLNGQGRAGVLAYRQAFEWLQQQPPGPVLAPEPLHNLYFRFYAHTTAPAGRWQFDHRPQPGRHYTYVAAFPNQRGAFQPHYPFRPVFANAQVEIYRLPAAE